MKVAWAIGTILAAGIGVAAFFASAAFFSKGDSLLGVFVVFISVASFAGFPWCVIGACRS